MSNTLSIYMVYASLKSNISVHKLINAAVNRLIHSCYIKETLPCNKLHESNRVEVVVQSVPSVFSNMLTRGPRPLVLCGPSGSGKSTLIQRMCNEFPNTFGFSISHTTRSPRPSEEHGKHYYFTTREQMQDGVDKGEFIETATFNNNMYGTSKQAVQDVMKAGKICVLDIDIEGVKQIKNTSLDPLLIFIKPPSIEQLEERLKARNTETQESLHRRLSIAVQEMKYGEEPGNFHLVIVNDDVHQAYDKLREFILNEIKQYNKEGEK